MLSIGREAAHQPPELKDRVRPRTAPSVAATLGVLLAERTTKLGARQGRWLLLVVLSALTAVFIPVVTAQPASAHHQATIWVGSPSESTTWGLAGHADTLPSSHHKLAKASPQNDYSVDLANPAGSLAVHLYAAPSNTALNNRVTARIEQIVDDNACRLGGGGDFITVGLYLDGTRYGRVTYAHIDRNSSLYVGKPVARWGEWIGTIATSMANSGGSNCWTGPHLHMELRAESHYACWNRGWSLGQRVYRTNFIGFISGPIGSSPAPCP